MVVLFMACIAERFGIADDPVRTYKDPSRPNCSVDENDKLFVPTIKCNFPIIISIFNEINEVIKYV